MDIKTYFETCGRDVYHNGRRKRVIYNDRNIQRKMTFFIHDGPFNLDEPVTLDTTKFKIIGIQPPMPNGTITCLVNLNTLF